MAVVRAQFVPRHGITAGNATEVRTIMLVWAGRPAPRNAGFPMKDHHGCPVQASINVLSGKWKVQILWHLSFGPRRFAQIRKKIPRISEKVLTDQLRQLESDGVIARQVIPSSPPQVTYSLNREGEKLVPLMESLCNWGSAHFGIKPNLPRPARPQPSSL